MTNHEERRKHKRFPAIKNLAEQVELTIIEPNATHPRSLPGIITNISAGGLDMVLMGTLDGTALFRLNIRLPGFDHCEVEGKMAWSRPKGPTTALGIEFTKIDKAHAKQINHMAEEYWKSKTSTAAKPKRD